MSTIPMQPSVPAAAALQKPDVLVLGCGISGLSTGILLARLGHRVTIWAKDLPPYTTSNAAAAVWWPFLSAPADKVSGWGQMSLHYYQHYMLPEPESGVMACFAQDLFKEKMSDDKIPAWAASFPTFRRLTPAEIPVGYKDGWGMDSVVINSDVALHYLIRKFRDQYKGTIVKREVKSVDEAFSFCPICASADASRSMFNSVQMLIEFQVINCTGLGSRNLFNDPTVYPVRGQVLKIRPSGSKTSLFDDHDFQRGISYVIPRQNDVIVGGTAQEYDWREKPSKKDTKEILQRVAANFPEYKKVKIIEVKVGLRPARKEVRVETEAYDNGKKIVIHNYGHGGSGWTLAWGCGMEVCQLLNAALPLAGHSKL